MLACSSNHRKLTENCTLEKTFNGDFDLKVRFGDSVHIYRDIRKLGRTSDGIVVYNFQNNDFRWTYIFDGIAVVKSWGPYSDQEFRLRSKELEISNIAINHISKIWEDAK